jgi:hypothetical protein
MGDCPAPLAITEKQSLLYIYRLFFPSIYNRLYATFPHIEPLGSGNKRGIFWFNGWAMITEVFHFHQATLWCIGTLSFFVFVGTLVAIPILVIYIPEDYFTYRGTKIHDRSSRDYSVFRLIGLVLKNIVGIIFLLAGIAMLVLPGQGIITLLIGIMLLNFPGKLTLERRIIGQPSVLRAINWMRLKAQKPTLELPQKGKGRY